jgi:hypothetical protein
MLLRKDKTAMRTIHDLFPGTYTVANGGIDDGYIIRITFQGLLLVGGAYPSVSFPEYLSSKR